ncbi:MAG TPA: cytosine permease, partial [Candidatus Acidoferrum sp.]|nr:cytosine permease [Candidatus Acidoferrum sp.]
MTEIDRIKASSNERWYPDGRVELMDPILLKSHPGTRYGIPFPVFARAAYGTIGSNLPALMRALVACGWFGIETWIGGEALHIFFA